MSRLDEARALRASGLRPVEIAARMGVSKQRVSQLIGSPRPPRKPKPPTRPRVLVVGGTCWHGHPITGPEDIVIHGRTHPVRRCRACVRAAHVAWDAAHRKTPL